jgi:hypothetical protein
MKKLCSILLFLVIARTTYAQSVALNLYGGYTFQDHVTMGYYNSYNNYGYLNASGQFGAGLEFYLRRYSSVELSYQYMGTHAPFYDYVGQTNPGNDKASLNYILVNFNEYFPTPGPVVPYISGGVGVGIADFHYYETTSNSITKFAWNIRGGVKIRTHSVVQIKLHAYLQSMVDAVGYGYYPGEVVTYATMLQFGLGGALSFRFGGTHGGGGGGRRTQSTTSYYYY